MKHIVVIGGGVAGMKCAVLLRERGVKVTLVEQEKKLGGKLRSWHRLFPDFTPSADVVASLVGQVERSGVSVVAGQRVVAVSRERVGLASGVEIGCDAVVVATGFTPFDAGRKEEYGYGLYDNVVTTVDVERMFGMGGVRCRNAAPPSTLAILHCVGSRDEKVGAHHCSKVCCVTAVKQSIEIKRALPECEIFDFYMDMRMFGCGYEELYRQAQEQYGVHFIRGRVSEISPTLDERLGIKAEDTLIGRPLHLTVDMVVLAVGMWGNNSDAKWAANVGMDVSPSGFLPVVSPILRPSYSLAEGVFLAGAVSSPKSIPESIADGAVAAAEVCAYLKRGG